MGICKSTLLVLNESNSNWLAYSLWFTGGGISLFLALYGCIASMMFDYRKIEDLCLGLSLMLPFPCFLIGFRSKRWSATLLWFGFAALWLARANIHPNPALNPVDSLGALYLCPAVAVQLAIFFTWKNKQQVAPE